MSAKKDLVKGLWDENPLFRMMIGLCPTLAVTNSAVNALSMGLATFFVLFSSSTIVSIIKKYIPAQIRLASYVVIIATFVTVADMYMAANFPEISKALGPYVPLIVVNCLILGRAETFASKNPLKNSMADAAGMGLGFTWGMLLIGAIRELIGSGSIFFLTVLGPWYQPWLVMLLPPGAFFTLGITLGLLNHFSGKKGEAQHQH